jgi:ATP-dependent DNA ligase
MLPGIFEPTIFSRAMMRPNAQFIRPIHPKTEIRPQPDAIARILKLGWVGQTKIDGHRAQVHIHADQSIKSIAFNRQGQVHKKHFPEALTYELRRILPINSGWTVIDCEWLKANDHLYLFDVIKLNDQLLKTMTYAERYNLLPQIYKSDLIETLALYKTTAKCMEVLESVGEHIEGLVFRAMNSKGFSDTSIVRCRILNRN